jgi:hypothetical protein
VSERYFFQSKLASRQAKARCGKRSGLFTFVRRSGLFLHHPIADQQNYRANNREDDTANIQPIDPTQADQTADKATDHTADDAYNGCDDEATGVIARQNKFRNETEHNL